MTTSKHVLAVLVCGLLVVAGCTAAPGGPGASPTDSPTDHDGTPPTDRTPTETTPTEGNPGDGTPVAHEAYVFDTGFGGPVIEGGITHDVDDDYAGQRYVTVVDSAAAAVDRFNYSLLRGDASAFVNETDFSSASLVVVQTFPASSVPDVRVESVTRSDGDLRVRVNSSSKYATSDITVETLLLRVQGDAPDSVTITTAHGVTFTTATGVVTVTPDPTPTPEPSIELPYASDDSAENVDDPRGLRVENAGEDVNGFNVSVTYRDVPDCRDDETPCGMPTKTVEIYNHLDKLRPGTNHTVAELALRRGNYTVTVHAEVPDGDGSRRTITEEHRWHLDDSSGDLVVTIADDDVSVRTESNG